MSVAWSSIMYFIYLLLLFFFWISYLVGLPLFTNNKNALSNQYVLGEELLTWLAAEPQGCCFFVVTFVHNINVVVVKYIGLLSWLWSQQTIPYLDILNCSLHHHHHPTAAAAEWTAACYYYCNYKEAWGNEYEIMMVKSSLPHWMMISDITLLIPNIINHMFDVIPKNGCHLIFVIYNFTRKLQEKVFEI